MSRKGVAPTQRKLIDWCSQGLTAAYLAKLQGRMVGSYQVTSPPRAASLCTLAGRLPEGNPGANLTR